jgi:hypothetical protein
MRVCSDRRLREENVPERAGPVRPPCPPPKFNKTIVLPFGKSSLLARTKFFTGGEKAAAEASRVCDRLRRKSATNWTKRKVDSRENFSLAQASPTPDSLLRMRFGPKKTKKKPSKTCKFTFVFSGRSSRTEQQRVSISNLVVPFVCIPHSSLEMRCCNRIFNFPDAR